MSGAWLPVQARLLRLGSKYSSIRVERTDISPDLEHQEPHAGLCILPAVWLPEIAHPAVRIQRWRPLHGLGREPRRYGDIR